MENKITIGDLKKRKTAQSVLENMHTCKYCGCQTTQDDELCYKNNELTSENVQKLKRNLKS